MSLLNSEIRIQPSKEAIVQNTVNAITHSPAKTFRDLVKIQNMGISMVWNNPNATPQEIIDGLGDNAIKVFQFHGALTNFLINISQIDGIDYTPALPSNAFTVNLSAGTITVLEQPYIG